MDLQQQTKIEAIAPGSPVKRGCASDWVAVAGRWVLGLVFIYMGVSKALEPDEFLKLVRQYELVSNFYLLNILAAALPWFEIFCGLLLLTGVAVRGAALVSLGMLVPFSLLVLKRALEVASAKGLPFCVVKFDCGCGNGEVLICSKLVENLALILLSAWLLLGNGRRLALRFSLFERGQAGNY